jgi:hypothetical protein
MDWYIVEYLYPESYNLFIKTMFPNTGLVSLSLLKNFDLKKLYSFFDKQEIYLILELNMSNQWNYIIKKNNTFLSANSSTRNSRDEIEFDGFMQCFKHLELVINNKQKV